MMKRPPAIDFVRSRKLRRNPRFASLLAFGAFFDDKVARERAQWAVECVSQWRVREKDGAGTPDVLELLQSVLRSSLAGVSDQVPLTFGLSSGLDSRPLLNALWNLERHPFLFTYGQVGNLDFDFSHDVASRFDLDVEYIDTSRAEWSLDDLEDEARYTLDLPVSPRVLAAKLLRERFVSYLDVHGYLNDALTQRRDANSHPRDWDLAVSGFLGANDSFQFQQLLPEGVSRGLVASEPLVAADDFDLPRQLKLSYRQHQRIRPQEPTGVNSLTPYASPEWVGYWLTRDHQDVLGQRHWISTLRDSGNPLMVDVRDHPGETRRELDAQRVKAFYSTHQPTRDAASNPAQFALPARPHQHFSVKACYLNNESFRHTVDASIARLRGRKVFDASFVDRIVKDFEDGEQHSDPRINGLVTTDLMLEVERV
jgi:hypothetical protein